MSNIDKKAVREFFTGTAMEYSKLFLARRSGSNFGFRERMRLAEQMTNDVSGRLLDCACGTGEITTVILRSGRFTSATVIDLSPRMLQVAEQRIESQLKDSRIDRLEFVCSDIFEFTKQPHAGQYDLILCLGLIAHTGRLDDLLAGLKPLLSQKGRLLLQSSLLDHLGTKVVRALTRGRYYRQHGYRISYFHHQNIMRAAENAGLEVVLVRRFMLGFPFGDRIWAEMNYRLEQGLQNWAGLHGAEAMYLLRHNFREA